MNFHPDVLAAHAEFGGDLESMQKLYEYPELKERAERLQRLFDQQWKRSREAGELWRQAHPGNDDVSPDLGELLTWLISRATTPQLFGPYAHLNGHRALSEDSWTVEDDPIGNDVEYFSIPLFAKVDVKFPVTYGEPGAAAYEAYADELRALATDTPVAFGLEAQGHIPTVEAALSEGVDWQEIGRRIGWDGDTAKSYYERHLARTANNPNGSASIRQRGEGE